MNKIFSKDMLKATQLTRHGRLTDAVALIQRVLRGQTSNAHEDPKGPDKKGLDFKSLPAETPTLLPAARSQVNQRETAPPLLYRGKAGIEKYRTGFFSRTFSNAFGARNFKLFVPTSYRGEALPLIVMLHGCTQSPDDFAAGTQMNLLGEEEGFFVLYPEQPRSANGQKCWNWFNRKDQQRDMGEAALIAGITKKVLQDYTVDHGRVYVAGLSAGGAAAAIMGQCYPDLYAAIGVHSGLACGVATDIPSAFAAMRNGGKSSKTIRGNLVPTIVFHSDKDATVHPINAEQVIAQAGGGQYFRQIKIHGHIQDGHAFTRTIHSDAEGTVFLEQWLIHGGGHAWSGGSKAGTYTDPQGPNASREMLRFFFDHRNRPFSS